MKYEIGLKILLEMISTLEYFMMINTLKLINTLIHYSHNNSNVHFFCILSNSTCVYITKHISKICFNLFNKKNFENFKLTF